MASKAPKASKDDPLLQRLDTLIRIQARIAVAHLGTQKEKILFLASAGLGPTAIGDILGISANNANVTLVHARKTKKLPLKNSGQENGE